MNKPECCLIDADIIRYQDGAVLSKGDTITMGGAKIDIPQSEDAVRKRIKERIDAIMEATGTKEFLIFLSYGKNFRYQRATLQPYKGNREGFVKPFHFKTIQRIFEEEYASNLVRCNQFEADDFLGTFQEGDKTVICSRDKDLRIVGGWHYSWEAGKLNPEKPLYWIDELEGLRWFYTQCLTGDSTDNIIGCGERLPTKKDKTKLRRQGVGRKAADNLLQHCVDEVEMFAVVRSQYRLRFGGDGDRRFKENGTLLWMSGELIPWEDLPKTKEMFSKKDEY
ncbi:PIN domain-like protein [Vibrio phage 1.262.O._10N.286.51.A9]|nr:PIN domain-like protein [Vibrio phage 1.262.O._10N.286.51.A9]